MFQSRDARAIWRWGGGDPEQTKEFQWFLCPHAQNPNITADKEQTWDPGYLQGPQGGARLKAGGTPQSNGCSLADCGSQPTLPVLCLGCSQMEGDFCYSDLLQKSISRERALGHKRWQSSRSSKPLPTAQCRFPTC